MPFVLDARALENRGAHWLGVIARLKPGVTLAQASADLGVIAARLEAAYPAKNKGWGVVVTPLSEAVVGRSKKPLLLLLGAVGFVCSSPASTCRTCSWRAASAGAGKSPSAPLWERDGPGCVRPAPDREPRPRARGGAAGALLAVWGAEALVALSAGTLPRSAEAGVDGRVLLFALAASLATAVVSGLWPALRATTAADGETLREGHGSAGLPRGAARARRALLVVELALTMVLLAGAVLLLRSMAAVLRVDPVSGPRARSRPASSCRSPGITGAQQQAVFYRELQSRIAALPGVAAVGTSNFAPLSGSRWTLSTKFLDHPVPAGDEPSLEYRVAGGEFFRAAGIPLKRGRFFTAEDRADAPLVAIVTEAAARRHFPAEDPIGRQIVIGDRVKEPRRIVGIVGDVLEGGLTEPAAPELYVPAEQVPWSGMVLVVRTRRATPCALFPPSAPPSLPLTAPCPWRTSAASPTPCLDLSASAVSR